MALAHRGFAPQGTENSMAAFAAAVELGFGVVETDVRVTADGVALAFHDDVLDRVCDRRGVVSQLGWREVARARIAGCEPIPRLDELLGTWADLRVNIDIKSDIGVAATLAAIARTGAGRRVCLGAFSDSRMRRIRRRVGPDIMTALSPGEVALLKAASRAGPAVQRRMLGGLRGRVAQVPVRHRQLGIVDPALLAAAGRCGICVHAWTVNDVPAMNDLLDMGVDGLITDRADLLRAVLIGRGRWPARSS